MHQSIPAAPCPPLGNCRAFACLVSPGGGALANLVRLWARALANPGTRPKNLSRFSKGMFS